jgi:WS/DGAT/MGAT family acyltransferase
MSTGPLPDNQAVELDPRMASFDAVMFGVEADPLLRSVITLVAFLDREPDRTVILERAERMSRMHPKLRQRAVGNPLSIAPPRWETDPNFDFDYHIRWRRLPAAQSSVQGVLEYAERMNEQDFDRSRPLWECAVLTDLDGGAAAVVMKVHHSITDGMGGMAMGAVLFDLTREPADLGPMPSAPVPRPSGIVGRIRQGIEFEARQLLGEFSTAADHALSGAKNAVKHPLGSTLAAAEFATAAVKMLAPQGAPLSPLMIGRSLSVRFTIVEGTLAELKDAAKAADTSLNVVFMATVIGGLREYHRRSGHDLQSIRVNMPISVRTAADEAGGNRWVPARFILPTGGENAAETIRLLRPVLWDAQQDPALGMSDLVYRLLTVLPRPVTTALAGSLMKGVDVAATNVPGPPMDLYTAGAKVTALVPFAPKAGAAANIGLMSYAGRVFLGINCDPAAIAEPDVFTDCVRDALAEVVATGGEPKPRRAPRRPTKRG